MAIPRGSLIVLEGLEYSGKSTVVTKLLNDFPNSVVTEFPNQQGPFGSLINGYLSKWINVTPAAAHLLQSAQRWNRVPDILSYLYSGTNVICERYCYSAIVHSMCSGCLKCAWCRQTEEGLPKPDLVIFLDASLETINQRRVFHPTTSQRSRMQSTYDKFHHLKWLEGNWKSVDANNSQEDVYGEVYNLAYAEINQQHFTIRLI